MKRIFLLAVTSLLLASNVFAQITNHGLDPSFGNGGIAPTNIYTNKKFKIPTGLIIQLNSKILISGNFIARYKADGKPDSSFATNGFFVPPYSWFSNSIALLPDGKILSIGGPDTGCSYIVRLLPNGTIDSSFELNGISKNNRLNPWNILAQPDGKIIIMGNGCGNVGNPHDPADSVIVGRFLPDGSVDTTFGKKGFAGAYLGNYGGSITNMGLLPDGRIAMGGIGHDDSGNVKVIILRYMPDGSPDTTLGGTGRIFPFYAWYCHALAVLKDGRMIFTLADLNYEDLTRINADGSLDTTFGDSGFVTLDNFGIGYLLPLLDGRILCSGATNGDASIACLYPDGKGLDSSFGQHGLITTDLTGYSKDYIGFLALQSDDKIVGFGSGQLSKTTASEVMLVRYNANAATGIQYNVRPSDASLTVYPNPARSHIILSGIALDKISTVQITALDGRMLNAIIAPLSMSIPVAAYPPGVYLLRVVQKTGVASYHRFTIIQ